MDTKHDRISAEVDSDRAGRSIHVSWRLGESQLLIIHWSGSFAASGHTRWEGRSLPTGLNKGVTNRIKQIFWPIAWRSVITAKVNEMRANSNPKARETGAPPSGAREGATQKIKIGGPPQTHISRSVARLGQTRASRNESKVVGYRGRVIDM